MLSAERLLGGATDELLRETDSAYKDITDELYDEYRALARPADRFHGPFGGRARGSPALAAIEPAQKILDRILFIAFAQRTDLLPDRLLERAAKARTSSCRSRSGGTFSRCFRAIDKGNDRLDVWPYNGGLFAQDPVADALILPDALAARRRQARPMGLSAAKCRSRCSAMSSSNRSPISSG